MAVAIPFREQIAHWTDADLAQYALAVALGLMNPDRTSFATDAKHVFWSANPIGDALLEILRRLTAAGVLQSRDEPDVQFRWSPDFRGSWRESG